MFASILHGNWAGWLARVVVAVVALAAGADAALGQTAFIPTDRTPSSAPRRAVSRSDFPGEVVVDADEYYSRQQVTRFGEAVDTLFNGQTIDGVTPYDQQAEPDEDWTWQVLPEGLIYRSYLAGTKESRMSGTAFYEKDMGWLFDVTLGGRVGLFRYGTTNGSAPEGIEVDIEGAAMPRLDFNKDLDLVAADFRFGVPLTYGVGKFRAKLAYYHLSSHLGDESLIADPSLGASRINFSRDVLVLGGAYYVNPSLRIYAEAGWGFYADEATDPWEFQFGLDYSPIDSDGAYGAPFFAINSQLREELNFSGNLVVQTGWQWRGASGRLLRTGFQYYNGNSNQFQFVATHEQQFGIGVWYDY